jgi:DNA-binding IscR family transcriptional regulator
LNTRCTAYAGSRLRSSARDLAALQGISPAFLGKIFQKLEKGELSRRAGVRGDYRLEALPKTGSLSDIAL